MGLWATLAAPAGAANVASDDGSNYSSFGTFSGSNLGTGFGAWTITGSDNNSSHEGTYLDTGSKAISVGTKCWGFYANSGQVVDAVRLFTGSLSAGQVFQVDLQFDGIGNGSGHSAPPGNGSARQAGFELRSGSTARFRFYFIGGASNCAFDDNAGNNNSIGTGGFPSGGFRVVFKLITADTYEFTVISPNSGTVIYGSGTRTLMGTSGSGIDRVDLYDNDNQDGSSGNCYFNNLKIGYDAPAISSQPSSSTTACAGGGASTSVTGSSTDGSTLSYAWRRRGNGWTAWTMGVNGGNIFLASSGQIDSSTGNAWGLQQTSGSIATDAIRALPSTLAANQTISLDFDNKSVVSGGSVGISLQDSGGNNAFEFYFSGGGANYSIRDNSGSARNTGLPFTSTGLHLDFTLTSSTGYSLQVKRLSDGATYLLTGTTIGSVSLQRVRFFCFASGAGNNVYFNNLVAQGADDNAGNYGSWNGSTTTGLGQQPLTGSTLGGGTTFSGATTATLSFSGANTADSGKVFDCAVMSGQGYTTVSSASTLTVNPGPTAFSVTGGGAYCSGGSGVAVGLSGSQSSVTYQLYRNGGATAVGSPVSGTGSAISFGNQTVADTYTVVATTNTTLCTAAMTGSATVTINARPTSIVSGGGTICNGDSSLIQAALTGSGPWSVTWSDGFSHSVSASPDSRTVSPGLTTIYTVTALSDANCTAQAGDRTGSATVTVNARPTSTVSGGGTVCNGGSSLIQAALTGSGPWSVTWSDGFSHSVSVSPDSRTVSPGLTTIYTVTSLSDANCTAQAGDRTGSATVTVNARPTSTVSGGGTICNGGSSIIQAALTGAGPWSVTWSDGFSHSVSASPDTRTVSPGATTIYTVTTLSDANCASQAGDRTGSATVTVEKAPLIWIGGNGSWDFTSTGLWQDSNAVPSTYCDGYDVLLDDSASVTSPTISLGTTVAPTSLTNNSTKNYTISGTGKITGSASLTKLGGSTLTVGTANDSTGATTISAGTLLVNGALGSGAVTVESGATLGGSGTIAGPVTVQVGGILGPGASIGTLTVANAVTLGGTTSMEINKSGATTTSDKLVRSGGDLSYGGTLTVTLLGGSDALTGGETFDLFDATSFSSSFGTLNLPSLAAGLNWWTDPLVVDGTIVVNRAPTAFNKTYTRQKDTSLKISKAGLLSDASDLDSGDSASYDTFIYSGSATVTQDVNYIYYQPADNNPDTMQYRVKDTRGGTTTRNIQINVTNGVGQAVSLMVSGGTATATFAGIPGYSYQIQRSTNLTDWVTLTTTNAPAAGVFQWVDDFSDLGGQPSSAYYRLRQP
jgi:autotransporter-associated beta strand protein